MNKARSAMFDLILGPIRSKVIWCIAKLDIVDYLSEKSMTAQELAVITSTNKEMLYRLLRAAVSTGLLIENNENQFSVTELGSTLKRGGEQCMKDCCDLFITFGTEIPVSKLLNALKEGTVGDESEPFFEMAEKEPHLFTTAHRAFKEFNQLVMADLLIYNYDYSKFKHIIDVGGGIGEWLIDILKKTPGTTGTIFDLPSVVELAEKNIQCSSVKESCTAVAGDFFSFVPDGGDCYILKSIIHDWYDEKALIILKNVRKSMNNNSTLLVMELMKEGTDPNMIDMFDMWIFQALSGKERSKSEFEKLFEQASLKMKEVCHFDPSPMKIIEFQPM